MRDHFSALQKDIDETLKAVADDKDLTPEQVKANDEKFAKLDALKVKMDQAEKLASYKFAKNDPKEVVKAVEVEGKADFMKIEDRNAKPENFSREDVSKALTRWAVTGVVDQAYSTIITTTASGAMLPKLVLDPIVATAANPFRLAYSVLGRTVENVGTTASISVPVVDVSAGSKLTEGVTSESSNDETLSHSLALVFAGYQSGTTWVTNMTMRANTWDFTPAVLQDEIYAKELALESDIVTTIVADGGITQSQATNTSSGFTFGNLQGLRRSLPKRYQNNQVIILSKTAFNAAEGMVDTVGQPVLVVDPQDGTLLRFQGVPVLESDYLDDLPASGSTKKIGITFSLTGFKLIDSGENSVTRYTQNPAKPESLGFLTVGYHAYAYDPAAVSKFTAS